jgi:2-polyprenyl-3-methyl-5-hydroxy-6-metoxy-1,4-benzoquinol methylase
MRDPDDVTDTASEAYTERLARLEGAAWKRWLNVQTPYRWNIRRLKLGRTLDIGCGIGRNLSHMDGQGVGVDHNAASIETCRRRGFRAYTSDEFFSTEDARPGSFDSMLVAHLLEHVSSEQGTAILRLYLPCIRTGGRVVLITPQERGYDTDASHVRFVGFDEMHALAASIGLGVEQRYSFPFPRVVGRVFPYNEFVMVLRAVAAEV